MSLLAWPLTAFGLCFMYGWARWLLGPRERRFSLLTGLTTLSLSAGTLSLAMLWLGILGFFVDWWAAGGVCLVVGLAGWLVWRRFGGTAQPHGSEAPPRPAYLLLTRLAVAVILGMAGLILFNAAYWPFAIDDAIAIYAWYGKQIAITRLLPTGTLYETYPMFVPLLYAFTHQAAGWIDEGLAGMIPALMSVGVPGAAYVLGRLLYSRGTGLIAALLIVLAPMYTHWASSGYVDLPTGFYYGMTAIFLFRLARGGGWRDALLAGFMAGLAAWTKNSGLVIVPSLGLWLLYRWLVGGARLHYVLRQGSLLALGFAAVAGPWYVRNLLTAGLVVPPTGWTHLAERTLTSLFPYLADTRYGVIGWCFTAGLFVALGQVMRSRLRDDATALLAIGYLPFFASWWALVSYDGRFLLALTPIIAVMGARAVALLLNSVRFPNGMRQRAPALLTAVILLLALPAASAAVDHKPELLRRPFMSSEEKHRLRLGDRYDMALYLRTLPGYARVWVGDNLLPYHADGVSITVGGRPTRAQLLDYDYWVLSPGEVSPDWLDSGDPLYSKGGYRLYPVLIRCEAHEKE